MVVFYWSQGLLSLDYRVRVWVKVQSRIDDVSFIRTRIQDFLECFKTKSDDKAAALCECIANEFETEVAAVEVTIGIRGGDGLIIYTDWP